MPRDRSVFRAIGDDAAVIARPDAPCLLVTTDTLREGIHFSRHFTSPFLLGKKSLAVNLSDIAAMGGDPRYYVVSLSAPPETPVAWVGELYRGMRCRARDCGALLVGGDTTASEGGVSITITVIGTARRARVVYRNGARSGDHLYVTGTVGDAALGLALLRQNRAPAAAQPLLRRHRDPAPRVAAGRMLAASGAATSMIDISDGLVADLRHILKQSRVGARLERDALPLSPQYRRLCALSGGDVYGHALYGGEDYELLFTAPPEKQAAVARIGQALGLRITRIGTITRDNGCLEILDRCGRPVACDACGGYVHF